MTQAEGTIYFHMPVRWLQRALFDMPMRTPGTDFHWAHCAWNLKLYPIIEHGEVTVMQHEEQEWIKYSRSPEVHL